MEDDTSSAPEWSIDSDSEHELQSLCQYVHRHNVFKKTQNRQKQRCLPTMSSNLLRLSHVINGEAEEADAFEFFCLILSCIQPFHCDIQASPDEQLCLGGLSLGCLYSSRQFVCRNQFTTVWCQLVNLASVLSGISVIYAGPIFGPFVRGGVWQSVVCVFDVGLSLGILWWWNWVVPHSSNLGQFLSTFVGPCVYTQRGTRQTHIFVHFK